MSVAEAVTLIGAITAAIVSVVGACLNVYTAIQSTRTHQLVNGVSRILGTAARSQGQAEGRLAQATGDDTPKADTPLPV